MKRDGRTLVFLTGVGRSGGADATGFSFDERDPPADHAVVAGETCWFRLERL